MHDAGLEFYEGEGAALTMFDIMEEEESAQPGLPNITGSAGECHPGADLPADA